MAPSSAFRKAKSAAFSPPRPGKSKVTKSTKEKGAGRHSVGAMGNSKGPKQPSRKSRAGQRPKPRKPIRKGAAGTMRAILGEASSESDAEEGDEGRAWSEDDENMNMDTAVDEDGSVKNGPDDDDNDEDDDDDDDDDDDNAQEAEVEEDEDETSQTHDRALDLSSPEPDFILAEVTTKGTDATSPSSSSTTNPAIPLPLIHRIMHAHFSKPEQTALSSDARQLMGKYTEIFVKEAIRRCVDDKRERAAHGNGGGGGGAVIAGDTGWLEVEDLERIGVQLCLDF